MFRILKTPILLAALAVLLLGSPAARAEEPGFLERLSAETTALAERADRATVRVSAGGVQGVGVLVGDPARLVIPCRPLGANGEVHFVLPDGTSGTARRLAAEHELDVAVYALPEDVARGVTGLAPERRWALPRGRIAVLAGAQPRLLLAGGTRGPRDGLRLGGEDASGVLLAADGALLGFRSTVSRPAGYYDLSSYWGETVRYAVTLNAFTGRRHVAGGAEEEPAGPFVTTDDGKTFKLHVTPTVGDSLLVLGARPPASVLTANTFLPGALIHRVLADVEAHGRVRYAYLGVVPAAAQQGAGARLVTVVPDSPAAKAGLGEGEIVTALDGMPVADVSAFTRQLVLRAPGETVTLLVRGRAQPVRVVLGEQEDARTRLTTPRDLGLEVLPLSRELRSWFGLGDVEGVVVRTVRPTSPAAQAGLRRGDVILQGGDQPTRDEEELLAALAGAEGTIVLTVRRDGERLSLTLPLPAPRAGTGPR